MTAFFIATVTVKDEEKFKEYRTKAAGTFAPFNGKVVLLGNAEGILAGEVDHQSVGIVKFPDMEMLDKWYRSDDYQAIIPLRDEAADVTIVKYEQAKANKVR